MKKTALFHRICRTCYYYNIAYVVLLIISSFGIPAIFSYEAIIAFQERRLFSILNLVLLIPLVWLWIDNLVFVMKYDRYSKAIFPILFFTLFYSPYYYYRIRIKEKRPLINEKPVRKYEPLIEFEDYNNDSDFNEDNKKNLE